MVLDFSPSVLLYSVVKIHWWHILSVSLKPVLNLNDVFMWLCDESKHKHHTTLSGSSLNVYSICHQCLLWVLKHSLK